MILWAIGTIHYLNIVDGESADGFSALRWRIIVPSELLIHENVVTYVARNLVYSGCCLERFCYVLKASDRSDALNLMGISRLGL